MVLAQEAADDERAVERADVRDWHAEPRDARAKVVVGEIGLAQPVVDVPAAEPAHESRGERELLERPMR